MEFEENVEKFKGYEYTAATRFHRFFNNFS